MGVWQGLKLFLSYANYANLGVSKGALRELSTALGRGDSTSAQRGLNLAFTFNSLSSLAYATLLAGVALWLGHSTQGSAAQTWALGLWAIALLALLQRHVTFLITILRARQSFSATSRLAVFEAVVTLLAVGLGAWWGGLLGVYVGTLVVLLASWWWLQQVEPARLAWAWNRTELRRLIAIGSPILLFGVVTSLFRSVDKLMILFWMPDREFQLGCYSLALLVSGQLYGAGNLLAVVVTPRFSELLGRTGRRRSVVQLAARTVEWQSLALALLGGLSLIVAPTVLGRMLPAYEEGLRPLWYLVPGTLAASLALPAAQCLIAVDRQRATLPITLAALALGAALNSLAIAVGWGIEGVAMATSISYVAYWIALTLTAFWHGLTSRELRRYLGMTTLALGPTLLVVYGMEWLWKPAEGNWLLLAVKCAVALLAWGVSALVVWHVGGWYKLWRAELQDAKTSTR